jgi:hypothetical protein
MECSANAQKLGAAQEKNALYGEGHQPEADFNAVRI